MKKNKIVVILLIILLVCGCAKKDKLSEKPGKSKEKDKGDIIQKADKNNLVSYNGKLKVDGVNIVNQYGEKVILKGMSSHGLQWYSDYVNEDNIKILKNDWNSNIFRLAMYTDEGGYLSNKDIYNTLIEKVDMIIKQDMYVIIDWHILHDNNPMNHKDEAKEFFDKVSSKYKDSPNVIYEICNEPNGDVNWNNDIKPYADEIVKTIRENSKDSIIIVGTGTWSQDILDPINNKVDDGNVMYALHFYAGTHKDWLRERLKKALDSNLPVFVSEWGTTYADGNGGVDLDESKKWVEFMKENNLSWTNWSLCDKDEASALLKHGTSKNGFSDDDLSESGKFIKDAIKNS